MGYVFLSPLRAAAVGVTSAASSLAESSHPPSLRLHFLLDVIYRKEFAHPAHTHSAHEYVQKMRRVFVHIFCDVGEHRTVYGCILYRWSDVIWWRIH